MRRVVPLILAIMALATAALAAPPIVLLTVKNPLKIARPSETIVLDAAQLRQMLAVDDVRRVHVRDQASGKELLVQAVDVNDDGVFEQFLFQVDLAPLETRQYQLSVGEKQIPRREDFRAYGRFVQERRDDFAWENDRIAHRTYGTALETWAQEPLTSSAIDVWTKKVRRLVINDWYMVDNYHHDTGEGADMYSAGNTRGCGGSGIWAVGRLYPPANFRNSRLLANGPIRVMFELEYPAWDAKGVRVTEVKRITLDAGQNLGRFEDHFKFEGDAGSLQFAAGIRKSPEMDQHFDHESGVLRTWEPLDEGSLGCAVIVDPASVTTTAVDNKSNLVVAKLPPGGEAWYYAGFGWDQGGDFRNVEDWDLYLSQYAQRLRTPVQITLTAQ